MKPETADNLLELVKQNYNDIAADFDVTRKKALWPEIGEWTKAIKAGDKILDVGCGNGRLLEALQDKKVDYLGVDNSSELIKLAQRNYPRAKFLVGDILDLEKATTAQFDYIFCLAVLPHLPSQELRARALREMKDRLKVGGQLVISAWNLWAQPKYRLLILKNVWLKLSGRHKLAINDLLFPWKTAGGETKSLRYYHTFTGRELKGLVGKSGLQLEKFFKDQHNYWLVLKNN